MSSPATSSTRPYLIRALHEWCTDNGWTPYLAVQADRSVQVPQEYVNDGQIVLNVAYDATGSLQLGNEFIEFKARFNGRVREIIVPVNRVLAIYAKENGEGMAFPPVEEAEEIDGASAMDLSVLDSSSESVLTQAGSQADEHVLLPEPVDELHSTRSVVQLVPNTGVHPESSGDTEEDTPPPTPPAGGRPTLKRVK